jgi:shikimate dehydrogenase
VKLVLLGDPVRHSLSPTIQNAALAAASLVGSYEARTVDEAGLRGAFLEIRSGALDGANVTMPHKHRAALLCDRLEPLAQRTGAVNTLVRVGSEVIGHNTDIAGILGAWAENGLPVGRTVHVLGAGGAAAAALLAFEHGDVIVSARRQSAGMRLADSVGVSVDEVPWGSAVPGAVVVNATPLGMHGESLPEGVLTSATGLLDMAYGPAPTPAVLEMRARNLPAADGSDMLLAQGAASFRLWTGRSASVTGMRAAVVALVR